jgi:hypothetical protein
MEMGAHIKETAIRAGAVIIRVKKYFILCGIL